MKTLSYFYPYDTPSCKPHLETFSKSRIGSIRTFSGSVREVLRHKLFAKHYDIVIDGVCVLQLAGPNDFLMQCLADSKEPETYNNYLLYKRALARL